MVRHTVAKVLSFMLLTWLYLISIHKLVIMLTNELISNFILALVVFYLMQKMVNVEL